MKFKDEITFSIFIPIAFAIGILLDVFIKLPNKYFQTQINIVELANLLATILVAFLIPLFISKIIDDNKSIKACLIDELKALLNTIHGANEIIVSAYDKGSITKKDKDKIIWIQTETELKITSFQEQINIAYKNQAKSMCDELKKYCVDYMDFLTGDNVMLSSFKKVDITFLRSNKIKYSNVETGIKTLIQKVHKF